ncbi:MAG: hypothetical protein ABSH20_04080 [Tepidisphaeraceae bacterium]|jgi:hypothetical protein
MKVFLALAGGISMCRNSVCGVGLSAAVLLSGLAIQYPMPAEAAIHRDLKSSENSQQIVQALQSAHKLLAEANHDYRGHRVLAMHRVHMALKELGQTPAISVTKKTAHAAQSPVHEPQARSDAQLRKAQQILQGISGLTNARHAAAATHVGAAIDEINTALSIR